MGRLVSRSAMMHFCGITKDNNDSAKEYLKYSSVNYKRKNLAKYEKLFDHLSCQSFNPFDCEPSRDPQILINIASGIGVTEEKKRSLLNAKSAGELQRNKFHSDVLSIGGAAAYSDPIKKNNFLTFSKDHANKPAKSGKKGSPILTASIDADFLGTLAALQFSEPIIGLNS